MITSHPPSDEAMSILSKLYKEQLAYFVADPPSAQEYLQVGDAAVDESLETAPLAALTTVVGTLMNYDPAVMMR